MPELKPSYKKMFKLMIDKDVSKQDLRQHFSPTTVSKIYHGETVSMEVMMRICALLDCDIGDVMSFVR